MLEISKCLYNVMANIQCRTPYSDMNICLCPDKISYSLFECIYRRMFCAGENSVRYNIETGYTEVIDNEEYAICSRRLDMELIDFQKSDIDQDLEKFINLSQGNREYLASGVSILLTLRLKYPSGKILYEDIIMYKKNDYYTYRVTEIVMAIADKIKNNENCEKEVLTLLKMHERTSIIKENWEEIKEQYNYYLYQLTRILEKQNEFLDFASWRENQKEDAIRYSDDGIKVLLGGLKGIVKQYCCEGGLSDETMHEFEKRFAFKYPNILEKGNKTKNVENLWKMALELRERCAAVMSSERI